ncbi:MAG: transposase [Terrimicrobiaceae bacterium]
MSTKSEIKNNVEEEANSCVAVIGIDWADSGHALAVFSDPGSPQAEPELSMLAQEPGELQQWAQGLLARWPRGRIAIVIEQKKGPLINFLYGVERLAIHVVAPQSLAHYRKTFSMANVKADASDAVLLGRLFLLHPEAFPALERAAEEVRLLDAFCRQRRQALRELWVLVLRLRQVLKESYPQAITMLGGVLDNHLACSFLRRWPSWKALGKVRAQTIRKLFYACHFRSPDILEKRLKAIEDSVALTGDRATIEAAAVQTGHLCARMEPILRAVEDYDRRIEKLFARQPAAKLFSSFPGAGKQMAPRLLCAFELHAADLSKAEDIQRLSGVAPVQRASGKSLQICRRLARPIFLHQSFVEFSCWSTRQCCWANAFYQQQKERGKSTGSALRVLAFKWQRILFRCWKSNTPYDDARYLECLRLNNPVLYAKTLRLATK